MRAAKPADLVDQMAAEQSEVVKLLRAENRDLRKKLSSTGAKADLIIHAAQEALADFKPPTIIRRQSAALGKDTVHAVAHLSDTQWGKITATYSSSIASDRVAEYVERVLACIEHRRKTDRVDRLHLYLGGDMIEGELIFPGQAHSIDTSAFDQAVRNCPGSIARAVKSFLAADLDVSVVAVCGNHGRPASKHAGSHPRTNWDRVCYEMARTMVGPQAGLSWLISDDFWAVEDVAGHGHLIVHGHQIRGGFGGFPFYGVGKKLTGWIDAVPADWHHLYFGHFHTYTSGYINGRTWYCNGTTESDNDYAREELAASGRPMQRFQFWGEELGLLSDHPIYLTAGLDPRHAARANRAPASRRANRHKGKARRS